MGKEPKVVIGIPVFNEFRFIKETLKSVLLQDYPNFVAVVSDNFSTDGTSNILEAYRGERIKIFRPPVRLAMHDNFIFVFRMALEENPKYFMWLGGHDLISRNYVSSCVEVLERYPRVGLCFAKSFLISKEGKVLKEFKHPDTFAVSNPVERYRRILRSFTGDMIHGLVRVELLRKVKFLMTSSPDHLIVCQLSLLCRFKRCDEAVFSRRYFPERKREELPERMARIGRRDRIAEAVFGKYWYHFKDLILFLYAILTLEVSATARAFALRETLLYFAEKYLARAGKFTSMGKFTPRFWGRE